MIISLLPIIAPLFIVIKLWFISQELGRFLSLSKYFGNCLMFSRYVTTYWKADYVPGLFKPYIFEFNRIYANKFNRLHNPKIKKKYVKYMLILEATLEEIRSIV